MTGPTRKDSILMHALINLAHLDMSPWGKGGVGAALMRAYTKHQWASVSDLSPLVQLSEAQLRRRLAELVNQGLVAERRTERGKRQYMAVERHAQDYLAQAWEIIRLHNAKLVASGNANN